MSAAPPDTVLTAFSDFVAENLGLHFPKARWHELSKGLRDAAPDFGFTDPTACARWLMSSPLDRSQIEALASRLTIGETYFFRDDKYFKALADEILPRLIRLRQESGKYLRIWCAGCATGEEPYSIAMLLEDMGLDPKEWNISILGTDINPLFLRKASRGVYRKWSFRNTTEAVREKFFTESSEGRFELLPTIKSKVSFRYHNLAGNSYPSLVTDTNAMDLILCRNVLMYFTLKSQKSVIAKLRQCLVDGGRLLVSPSEIFDWLLTQFDATDVQGTTIFRKGAGLSHPEDYSEILTGELAPECPTSEVLPAQPPISSERTAPPLETAEGESRNPSAEARKLANQGRLAEAADLCRKALAADKFDPCSYYLLAVVLQEQGRIAEAEDTLRKALYLDQDYALAHFTMGNIARQQGKTADARRHWKNALKVLGRNGTEEPLPESEGLTAGRLMEIIRVLLAS